MSWLLPILLGLTALAAGDPATPGAPDPATLQAAWTATAPVNARLGRIPVELRESDFARLAAGDVVRRLVPAGDLLAAQGAVFVPTAAENVWVTIQDPEHRNIAKEDFPITRLPGSTPVRRLNYQLVKTPWPLANRQQVFAVDMGKSLWDATGGKAWERAITLLDPSLAPSADEDAVWLAHLAGGFLLVEADGGTLVVMRVETDPGGNIPQEIVTRLTQSTLGGALRRLVTYAVDSPNHYVGGHDAAVRPDGSPIPPGSLKP